MHDLNLFYEESFKVIFSFYCFCAEIKTQFDVTILNLRSDNVKEYMLEVFRFYKTQHSIIHQSSCVDAPTQNGVTEHKNRYLLETSRALLLQMKVPKQSWVDAISTTCFLINRMSSSILKGHDPYNVLCPHKPLFLIEARYLRAIAMSEKFIIM